MSITEGLKKCPNLVLVSGARCCGSVLPTCLELVNLTAWWHACFLYAAPAVAGASPPSRQRVVPHYPVASRSASYSTTPQVACIPTSSMASRSTARTSTPSQRVVLRPTCCLLPSSLPRTNYSFGLRLCTLSIRPPGQRRGPHPLSCSIKGHRRGVAALRARGAPGHGRGVCGCHAGG